MKKTVERVTAGFETARIGERVRGFDGIYAGISQGYYPVPDGHIMVIEESISPKEMTYTDAEAAANFKRSGLQCRLPSSHEARLISINLPHLFDPYSLYWTNSGIAREIVPGSGFLRVFGTTIAMDGGRLDHFPKHHCHRAFAIIRVPVIYDEEIDETEGDVIDALCSPGRLSFRENGESNSFALLTENKDWLLSVLHNGQQLDTVQKANMQRLAACWNACQGIKTSDLFSKPLKPSKASTRQSTKQDA